MMKGVKLSDYIYPLIFFSALIVSSLLKINFIDAKELWLDETSSSFLVSNSFIEMINRTLGNVHPPLYYIFLKTWSLVFGHTPAVLRAFSLIASIVLSLIFFFATKKLFADKWIPLVCFILVQLSPLLFYYSVEVRPYMLALCFLALSLYFYIDIMEGSETKPKKLFFFSASCACAFYTHYFAVFIIVAYFIHYFIYMVKDRLPIKPIVISAVLLAILTIPWYPILKNQRSLRADISIAMKTAEKNPETLNYGYVIWPKQSNTFFLKKTYYHINHGLFGKQIGGQENPVHKWLSRGFKFAIVCFLLLAVVKMNRAATLSVLIVVSHIMGIYIFSLFVPRYLLFLNIYVIICLGIALDQMKTPTWKRYFAVVSSIVILLSHAAGTLQASNIIYCRPNTQVVEYLKSNYEPGDFILFNSLLHQVPFDYYSNLSEFTAEKTGFPISIYEWWDQQGIKGWSGPVITKDDLNNFVEKLQSSEKIKRIWLVTSQKPKYDPGQKLLEKLSKSYGNSEKIEMDHCNGKYVSEKLDIYSFK